MKANQYEPDAITSRRMSDSCWNGKHFGMTVMVKDALGIRRQYDIGCAGWLEKEEPRKSLAHCECLCHEPQAVRPKISKQERAAKTMNIMESGCGTIEVK